MTDEAIARRMSELAAGLREAVSPPDQWEVSSDTFPPDRGSDYKPTTIITVHFRRKMLDGQVLHKLEAVSDILLEHSRLTPKQVAEYVAEKWRREADAKTLLLTKQQGEP